MKIQYKYAVIMTLFGVGIVILLSLGYNIQSHRIVMDKEMENIELLSEEIALHLESHIKQNAALAVTISSSPLIRDALQKSNSEFAALAGEERNKEIDRRNLRWTGTADINDPFIQARMTNPVAGYLKYQQIIMPGVYGEIFLTNRYGVMIATTGKLTTLAHGHKYWWLACHDDGRGRIFLDDRGFDTSVQGYVLGVVVPIWDENGISGILKCNVNIMGPLTGVVRAFDQRHPGRSKIVRTSGLIVAEQDVIPLSTRINKALIGALRLKESGSAIIAENGKKQLMAFTSIGITMGSEKYGFGGNRESIDHIKGNKGDGWHVVIALSEEEAIKYTLKTTLLIIIVGIVFTILAAAVALFLGKWATRPINELATVARAIGKGDLDSRARVFSNDEIGSLAKSLNGMAKNLRDTMTSRDELIHEVEQREKVEQKLRLLSTTDELTGAYNRRAFNGYLNSNIGRAKRYNEPLSMLMLDIDHFKDVNNSYGHDVGDMVLKDFVRIIKESIRHEDLIARWGGEEFTVLQPQTRKDAALKLSERLREKISAHDFPKAGRITVSIGLTELQVGDTADSFVKRADNALYLAKKGGRNVVKCC